MNTYKTHNVCSRSIEFEVENNIITACKFNGGCAGCPDQLATALEEYKANHAA